MSPNVFLPLIEDLEKNLASFTSECLGIYEHTQSAIGLCMITIEKVKKMVVVNEFLDEKDEVNFFKFIKPRLISKLIFYKNLARIESHRPESTKSNQKKYLSKKLSTFQKFYKEVEEFIEYYKSGQEHLDNLYFTRNQKKVLLNNRDSNYLLYPNFSTIHDGTVAKIMAYERLEKYLENEIGKIEYSLLPKHEKIVSHSKKQNKDWTGSNIDYVEILYAMKESGVINHGQSSVIELHQLFSRILNLPSIDIYRTFYDLQKRKKSKTHFLDKMKELLLKKLENMDDFGA